MAIDRVKKVWLVSPAARATEIPERLARIGLMHVAEVAPDAGPAPAPLRRLTPDTRAVEARVRKLTEALEALNSYVKAESDVIANFIPTPVEATRQEVQAALDAIDIDELHRRVGDLVGRRERAKAGGEQAQERLAALGAFRGLSVPVPCAAELRWTRAGLWVAAAKQARHVLDRALGPEAATLEELGTLDGRTLVAAVSLAEDGDFVAQRMRDLGFEPVAAPEASTTLDAYVAGIEGELAQNTEAAEAADAELAALAQEGRRQVELALGYWEDELATARAVGKVVATGRASVLTGYVRDRQLQQFQAAIARDMPEVSTVTADPTPEDNVPVSLSGPAILRPAQFLVSMYGLPDYFEFDPSVFLFASFLLFFGLCLGDAVYGLAVIGLALYLIRRFREYPGVRSLFELLLWGGIASFVVGVLTQAWASNLWAPEYLGEGNLLARISSRLAIGDPLARPVVMLVLALLIGVANQYWGIIVKIYSCWRKGDPWGGVFDGGFWLLLLTGVLLLIVPTFAEGIPASAVAVGKWLAIAGAAGLILTQGRNEKGIVGKAVVGVVSLYGIVGTYGCVSFISDVLSYSRLLALGLTTTIVGLAVNLVAGMLKDAAGAALLGGILFTILAVPGHTFNLLISGLGAFIHSARLIFVEFFGRFYEPKAERFAPLGTTYGRIRVTD